MSDLETFLAGQAPDYVAIVLADAVLDDPDALEAAAEPVDGGLALVLGGAAGRSVFQEVTGQDPMSFARAAGERDGHVARDLSGGDCPNAEVEPDAHRLNLVFSFAEARNETVGGMYAEGPVVHAYAQCACGTRYSDRWVAGKD